MLHVTTRDVWGGGAGPVLPLPNVSVAPLPLHSPVPPLNERQEKILWVTGKFIK